MENEKLYLEIINNLYEGVYFVDTERKITLWNSAAEDISGYTAEEMVGSYCHDNKLSHVDKDGRQLCLFGCPLSASVIDGHNRKDEVLLKHKNGYRVPVKINIFPLREEGKIVGAIEVFTQNSPAVYEESLIEKLSSLAMVDQLTGLANRRKLESFLDYKLREYNRFATEFSVVFLDIDDFAKFNNVYGHDAGDEVLKSVSKSIRLSMRANDLFGRWGGEEFIGVFDIKNEHEAVLIAEKVRVLIERTEVSYGELKLSVTASLGVTTVRSGDDMAKIIKRADALMYKSKQAGKNCVNSDGQQ